MHLLPHNMLRFLWWCDSERWWMMIWYTQATTSTKIKTESIDHLPLLSHTSPIFFGTFDFFSIYFIKTTMIKLPILVCFLCKNKWRWIICFFVDLLFHQSLALRKTNKCCCLGKADLWYQSIGQSPQPSWSITEQLYSATNGNSNPFTLMLQLCQQRGGFSRHPAAEQKQGEWREKMG